MGNEHLPITWETSTCPSHGKRALVHHMGNGHLPITWETSTCPSHRKRALVHHMGNDSLYPNPCSATWAHCLPAMCCRHQSPGIRTGARNRVRPSPMGRPNQGTNTHDAPHPSQVGKSHILHIHQLSPTTPHIPLFCSCRRASCMHMGTNGPCVVTACGHVCVCVRACVCVTDLSCKRVQT